MVLRAFAMLDQPFCTVEEGLCLWFGSQGNCVSHLALALGADSVGMDLIADFDGNVGRGSFLDWTDEFSRTCLIHLCAAHWNHLSHERGTVKRSHEDLFLG